MNKSKKKFYAVAVGNTPGIYEEWFGEKGAHVQVKGFPGAKYRGFTSLKEAQEWLRDFHDGKLEQPGLFKERETVNSSDEAETARELEKGGVIIYTDGGCLNNPGPGGYGAVLLYGDKRKELSGGYRLTTNNRMELMACIEGLKALKNSLPVILFSDSRYVVNGIRKGWAKRWRSKGWMRTKDNPAENADLWKQLLELCERRNVEFRWVKGHAGTTENERCDQLAKDAAGNKDNFKQDTAYETGKTIILGRNTA